MSYVSLHPPDVLFYRLTSTVFIITSIVFARTHTYIHVYIYIYIHIYGLLTSIRVTIFRQQINTSRSYPQTVISSCNICCPIFWHENVNEESKPPTQSIPQSKILLRKLISGQLVKNIDFDRSWNRVHQLTRSQDLTFEYSESDYNPERHKILYLFKTHCHFITQFKLSSQKFSIYMNLSN